MNAQLPTTKLRSSGIFSYSAATTQIYAKITNGKIGKDMDVLSEKIADKFKMAQYTIPSQGIFIYL